MKTGSDTYLLGVNFGGLKAIKVDLSGDITITKFKTPDKLAQLIGKPLKAMKNKRYLCYSHNNYFIIDLVHKSIPFTTNHGFIFLSNTTPFPSFDEDTMPLVINFFDESDRRYDIQAYSIGITNVKTGKRMNLFYYEDYQVTEDTVQSISRNCFLDVDGNGDFYFIARKAHMLCKFKLP